MIEKIEVTKEAIYIFLNKNEFGKFEKLDNKKETIMQVLKRNNLFKRGKKVIIMMSGIILASFILPFSYDEKINNYVDSSILKGNEVVIKLVEESKKEEIKEDQKENKEEIKKDVKKEESKEDKVNKESKKESSSNKKTNTSSKKTTSSSNKTNTATNKTETVKKDDTSKKEMTVKVYRSSNEVITLALEDYIIGVVSAEMPASFNSEALKAQAVVARTYALNLLSNNKKLTDTVATQVYKDKSQLKKQWGSSYQTYYNKIKNAVNATKGMVLTYQGSYIYAVYHSTSNGKTENAFAVWNVSYPYLKSVNSSWDQNVSSYKRTVTKSFDELNRVLGIKIDQPENIKLIRNDSGRVDEIIIGNKKYKGTEFRNSLGLRSTDFDIAFKNGEIVITTRGYGHGVGMSQYGANEMAKQGKTYKQILNHYYTNVKFSRVS